MQTEWSSKLEVIGSLALFLLVTEISCERLTDAFFYPVKVSLKLSSERKQKLASQSLQPKWVILSGNCTLYFSGHMKLGKTACPCQRLVPLPVSEPCCAAAVGTLLQPWASWTGTFSHPFWAGLLHRNTTSSKKATKNQLWYLTQNKVDINMYDCHFLRYLLS